MHTAETGAWLVLRYEDPAGLLNGGAPSAGVLQAHAALLDAVAGEAIRSGGDGGSEPVRMAFPSAGAAISAAAGIQLALRDPVLQASLEARSGAAARLQVAIGVGQEPDEAGALCGRARGGQVLCARRAWSEFRGALDHASADPYAWGPHSSGALECLYDTAQALLNAPFERMFAAELREWVIPLRAGRPGQAPPPLPYPERPDVRNGLYGVALSGGGMRSAVFSLGVLQALARHRVIADVDYLSTVSGGGYAGAALTSLCADELPYAGGPARFTWAKDLFPFGFLASDAPAAADAEEQRRIDEDARRFGSPVHGNETPALRHVREHANLLGRGIGLFDGYTWRMVGRFLTSTLLLWALFLLPVATLTGLIGIAAVRRIDTGILIFLADLPLVLFVAVAVLSTVVYYDPAHPLTRLFRRLLPITAGIAGVLAVMSVTAGAVWGVEQLRQALGGVTVSTAGGAISALSAGAIGTGLRRVSSSPLARHLAWSVAIGVGGYLLLGVISVTWFWLLWRYVEEGFRGIPTGALVVASLVLIAPTIGGDWGRRLLNHLPCMTCTWNGSGRHGRSAPSPGHTRRRTRGNRRAFRSQPSGPACGRVPNA